MERAHLLPVQGTTYLPQKTWVETGNFDVCNIMIPTNVNTRIHNKKF